jgi:hypothetical protein
LKSAARDAHTEKKLTHMIVLVINYDYDGEEMSFGGDKEVGACL